MIDVDNNFTYNKTARYTNSKGGLFMKKAISLLLSALMITALFTSLPFTAGAVTSDGAVGDEDYCSVWIYLSPTDTEPTAGVDILLGDTYEPAEPGRDNEVFMGWYTDRDCGHLYDPTQPIMTDISLFPHWETPDNDGNVYCSVWIYLNPTDTDPIAGVDVLLGDFYGTPSDPGRENEVFMGWYTDRYCIHMYDPTQPIMKDTALYPRWETPDIDGNVYCSVWIYLDPTYTEPTVGVDVPQGEVYGLPAEPGRENEAFLGWYTDRSLINPYDPTKPLTKDVSLFASWGEIVTGDANADGTVDIIDATTVQKHIAGAITLTDGRLSAADADGNGTVDINDVTAIQRFIAKLSDSIG